jgi:nucleotide-binding universal stress UspA family protein
MQMGEIVVGVDGSAGSRAALRWAAHTASARGVALRAVTAWHYPARAGSPIGPTELPAPDKMDRQSTERLRDVLREELDAAAEQVEVEVGRGPAASVLLAAAARPGVDMLVLGARGLGGFDGLMLGSVSQQCVEHSPCPIVVLRGEHVPSDGPIVVGLDGSEGATRALEWAIDLAEATDSQIVAVHAPRLIDGTKVLDAAGEALEQWCAPLRRREVAHEMRIEAGDARTAIEHAADVTDASLLVVGTRGLGAVRGLLLGSVAGYIVRYAKRPIAVVPRSSG